MWVSRLSSRWQKKNMCEFVFVSYFTSYNVMPSEWSTECVRDSFCLVSIWKMRRKRKNKKNAFVNCRLCLHWWNLFRAQVGSNRLKKTNNNKQQLIENRNVCLETDQMIHSRVFSVHKHWNAGHLFEFAKLDNFFCYSVWVCAEKKDVIFTPITKTFIIKPFLRKEAA